MIQNLLSLVPLLGAAAIVAVAQTKVRERSERAAMAMTLGGGVEIAFSLVHVFVRHELLWVVSPVAQVAAVGGVVFGLFTLLDELNPRSARALPPLLVPTTPYKPNLFQRGFFGVFGAMGLMAGGLYSPLGLLGGLAALAAVLYGSLWVDGQGPFHTWVLQRRPDLVLWGYVHQLRVVNRRSGSTSVHWTAQLGLSTGTVISIPATGEEQARQLVAAVLEIKPGILLGYSPENLSRFQAMSKGTQ